MKGFRKKVVKFLKAILIILVLSVGAYQGYKSWRYQQEQSASFNARPQVTFAKDGTSISPAWRNSAAYKKNLREKYPYLYSAAFETPALTKVGRNVVIPGLLQTKSYDFEAVKETYSHAMTPQGIAIAGKYLLISAYDYSYQHASVIYVLNKQTGKYLKTVQVEGRPHLGGITYDPIAKNVWVTGRQGGQAALFSFSLKTLKRYSSQDHEPIQYNHRITLPTMAVASMIYYYDNQLFVGVYSQEGSGVVGSYPIVRSGEFSGSITTDRIKAVTGSVSWSIESGSTSMDHQIQGFAIYGNKIFLSQSYGGSNSKLYIFPVTSLNALDEKNAEKVIEFPPYLEQIIVERGQLICVFESASSAYARDSITVMDRTLSLNINQLFSH